MVCFYVFWRIAVIFVVVFNSARTTHTVVQCPTIELHGTINGLYSNQFAGFICKGDTLRRTLMVTYDHYIGINVQCSGNVSSGWHPCCYKTVGLEIIDDTNLLCVTCSSQQDNRVSVLCEVTAIICSAEILCFGYINRILGIASVQFEESTRNDFKNAFVDEVLIINEDRFMICCAFSGSA